MLEKAEGYGYKHIGFILDRGYFSRENIRFMDKKKYSFVIMVKGMKTLVKELVLEVRGTFEDRREYTIRSHHVNGITVTGKLFPSDEKNRYFHIYYNDGKKRENVNAWNQRLIRWQPSSESVKEKSCRI